MTNYLTNILTLSNPTQSFPNPLLSLSQMRTTTKGSRVSQLFLRDGKTQDYFIPTHIFLPTTQPPAVQLLACSI